MSEEKAYRQSLLKNKEWKAWAWTWLPDNIKLLHWKLTGWKKYRFIVQVTCDNEADLAGVYPTLESAKEAVEKEIDMTLSWFDLLYDPIEDPYPFAASDAKAKEPFQFEVNIESYPINNPFLMTFILQDVAFVNEDKNGKE